MYGARAAAESGADMIKTYWTGSSETFAKVVDAAAGVPVLLSGGAKAENPVDFLKVVYGVVEAGGAGGAVVGRNIFQRENPEPLIKTLIRVIHRNEEPEEAAKAEGSSEPFLTPPFSRSRFLPITGSLGFYIGALTIRYT